MKPISLLFCIASLIFLSIPVSSGADRGGKSGTPLDKLRVRRQIAGWQEDKDGFARFNHEKLFDLINGGAPEYIDRGMLGGFVQRLSGPGNATVELFTEDFGTRENAAEMVKVKTEDGDSIITLPGFDAETVRIVPAIGACVAYGAIDRFYFEVTLSGAGSGGKEALAELGKFFLFYRGILK